MKVSIKKLAVGAMLVALAVSLSSFAIPTETSRCFPIQYLASVVVGVFLGPRHGVAMAFCTSLIHNLMDAGSLLAFSGNMIEALICGLVYRYSGRLMLTYVREIFGTGIVDDILCYPMATMVIGKETAIFAYVMPFLMNTLCSTVVTTFLIGVLCKSGAFKYMKHLLGTDIQPSKTARK